MRTLAALTVATTLLAQAGPSGVDVARLDAIPAVVEQAIADKKLPGAVVLVGRGDRVLWEKAIGRRAVEPAAEPMTLDTIFDLASLTKVIATTTSVMKLVEDGKVRLNDRVSDYVPGFERYRKANITIRHLMTHTSGLVRYEFKPEFTADLKKDPDRVWKPEDLLAYLFDTTAAFAPGQGWDYSDTNYIVVGMIIERATKSTY